jgi:hypothetical protein
MLIGLRTLFADFFLPKNDFKNFKFQGFQISNLKFKFEIFEI